MALGTEAEDDLRAAAAAGTARLHERLEEALGLARTQGEDQARAALGRASCRDGHVQDAAAKLTTSRGLVGAGTRPSADDRLDVSLRHWLMSAIS